jgi:hypothetical protein
MLGRIVKDGNWYPCICNTCGWVGSSEECGCDMGDWGDSDVYCPQCGSMNTDEYEHDIYPFYHPLTSLISRFKAWRIITKEDKYWNNFKAGE